MSNEKMALRFLCVVCKKYSNTDDLSSIRCGHIFHSSCILALLNWSYFCPCCENHCSPDDISKVYITSKPLETVEHLHENLKLKCELVQTIERLSDCQMKLDECQKNFTELQLQLDVVDNARMDRVREECLQTLVEIFSSFDVNEEVVARGRIINDLHKQLYEMSLQLEKETSKSTMLIADNMKLQALLVANKMPPVQKPASVANTTDSLAAQSPQAKASVAKTSASEQGAIPKQYLGIGTHNRMDTQSFHLFQYAKKLHQLGFKHVYDENNAIFAKINDGCMPVQINNMEQVDDIVNRFKAFNIVDASRK